MKATNAGHVPDIGSHSEGEGRLLLCPHRELARGTGEGTVSSLRSGPTGSDQHARQGPRSGGGQGGIAGDSAPSFSRASCGMGQAGPGLRGSYLEHVTGNIEPVSPTKR